MAFEERKLELLAGGGGSGGPSLYGYSTADAAATVDTTGYFNAASHILRVGDRIFANVGVGGAPAFGSFVVLSNAAGVVDVGDMTAIGVTDTD